MSTSIAATISPEVAGTPRPRSTALHVSLWIVQVLLAAAFAMAGLAKATTPIAELATKMSWVSSVPVALVRFIGTAELAAVLGLILPSVTRIKPLLTSLAASGLVLVMLLAAGFHASRGEIQMVPGNFLLGALAAFVAWGRFRKAPIPSR